MNELTQQALYKTEWNLFCDNVSPVLIYGAIFLICASIAFLIFWIGWTARGTQIKKDFTRHCDKIVMQEMKDLESDNKILKFENDFLKDQMKNKKYKVMGEIK